MTGLIGSLVGAASTAVERLTGTLNAQSNGTQGSTPGGEFAAMLAAISSPAAARGQSAVGLSVADHDMEGGAEPEAAEGELGENLQPGLSNLALALLGNPASVPQAEAVASAEEMDAAAPKHQLASAVAAGQGQNPDEGDLPSVDAELRIAAAMNRAGETKAVQFEQAAEPEALAGVAGSERVKEVNKDPDKLQPEFRKRLDRVIDRMEQEFGHSVTIVEAHRSQARQNHLYEQGRSRPGNVVTWTRNSNHTSGRAADVLIDGTYNNAIGYARLAKVAAEEGLKTLGPMDPGHVELPRSVPGGESAPRVASEPMSTPAPAASPGGLARVAEVARVADVAKVAQVAEVAQVARVARVADPTRPAPPVQAPAAVASAETVIAAASAGQAGQAALDGRGAGSTNTGSQRQRDSQPITSGEMELLRADSGFSRVFSGTTASEAQQVGGSDAVQRAAQILALKEGGSTSPVNHLLLRLDNPSGGEDRIRVDLRGNTVGTTLNIENAGEAERLASRVGELRQSLERQGLEADTVRIRTSQVSGLERADLARSAVAAGEAEAGRHGGNSRSGSDSSDSRDAWKEAQEQQRRDPGDPRNRSRREQRKEGSS